MSNFEIKSHELIFLENKRKSKTNSFYIFKLSTDNNVLLKNKKINISKKNNHIDITLTDKNTLSAINNEIKENLTNYISEKEIDVKNNLSKILFNDIFSNNKMNFNISENIDTDIINKKNKYDCSFNIPYVILIFTNAKISEINPKIELVSLNNDDCTEIIDNCDSSIDNVVINDHDESQDSEHENTKVEIVIKKKRGRPCKL
jgi:hypothetical protein